MALSGTQDMLLLPCLTQTLGNFNRLFLFPTALEDEYVHSTSKSHILPCTAFAKNRDCVLQL